MVMNWLRLKSVDSVTQGDMEPAMRASKLTAFIIATLALVSEAHAHPGHVHSYNLMDRVLHAAETEWLAPLLVVILIGIAGYFYLNHSGNDR